MSTEQLELLVPGDCALSLQLPQTVSLPPISAKFETERRVLSLLMRTNAAGSLDGGLGGDGEAASSGASTAVAPGASATDVLTEGVRREREKEARINARRKRAAGNKQLARQAEAEAEAAEAIAEAGGDGDTLAEAAGADAAAREAEEAEKEGAIVPAKAPEKPTGFLELTNSIMFELEELTGV